MRDLLDSLENVPAAPVAEKYSLCADIAVPLPIEGLYSYLIPPAFEALAKPGVRVLVPFKNREMTGYLVGVRAKAPDEMRLKPLIRILDQEPVLPQNILELTHWMADYYGCSWGEAIENALPRWVKYGKKAERALKKEKEEIWIVREARELILSSLLKKR